MSEPKYYVGSRRFVVLALLKDNPSTLYELQEIASLKGISNDTIRDNLRLLTRIGLLTVMKKKRGKFVKNEYILKEGAFCFMSMLFLTDFMCFFPCKHYVNCDDNDPCKLIHHVSMILGTNIQEVKRLGSSRFSKTNEYRYKKGAK